MTDLCVVGLGYVGLPLVQEACRAGLKVVGIDLSERVVAGLNEGASHVDDLQDAEVREMLEAGFVASSDYSIASEARTIVVCVPTPLSSSGGPDLRYVEASARSIATILKEGMLVVLESTTYPGTTAELFAPLLETSGLVANRDFWVAYSPERIDPGNTRYQLRNTPKVVGADHEEALVRAASFYREVVDTVVEAAGTREAEAAKLLENTYRHVNIALVNEMARFFHQLKVDFWDVIRLAETKPFGFAAFRPGPGVGGHCIPIDPNYLSHRVRSELGYGFRFVELAQEINASMPTYVVSRISELLNAQGRAINGSTILLLGVTYKPDIADERESPAVALGEALLSYGARLKYHDPLVMDWSVPATRSEDFLADARSSDLTVLVQAHSAYDIAELEAAATHLFDTRGVTRTAQAARL